MFYCEPCRVEKNWPRSSTKSNGDCAVCRKGASCYDLPASHLFHLPPKEGDLVTKTTEETEAARVARGPDWGSDTLSERDLLRAARDLVRQTLLLEQLKKRHCDLKEETSAAESSYQAAYDDLTGSVKVHGERRAFQVNDQVVVVGWPYGSNSATLEIVTLVPSPRVELGT